MPVIISCFEDVFVPVPSSSTTFCRFKTKKEFEEGVIQHIFTDGIIQIETRGTTQTRQVFVKHKVVTPMLSDFEMASIGGSSKSTCTTERTKACQNNCARILLLTHPTHASYYSLIPRMHPTHPSHAFVSAPQRVLSLATKFLCMKAAGRTRQSEARGRPCSWQCFGTRLPMWFTFTAATWVLHLSSFLVFLLAELRVRAFSMRNPYAIILSTGNV